MKDKLQDRVERYKKGNRKKKVWQRVVTVLAAVAVFCTTYVMILPAVTWERSLVCDQQEHQHTSSCYTTEEKGEEPVLICQLQEHEHTNSCFDAPPAEDDGYYCGQVEHIHSESQYCYYSDGTLSCSIPEHVHTLACKSNPQADVEHEADWCSSFASVSLSGNWAEDVIAIAETQIGYTESTRNYEVMEDETSIKGYTRYGDWYGDKYGDWSAMFCSFCLNYAGVNQNLMPITQDCEEWIKLLTENNLYHDLDSEYELKSGDLVFLDYDKDAAADHVGFAYKFNSNKVTTIEGDWDNCVSTVKHKFTDEEVLGYGELLEAPTVLMAAAPSNANSGKTVILACSDVQDPSNSFLFSNGNYNNQITIINNIVSKAKTYYPSITDFFCGGDYNFDVTREGRNYTENGVQKTYTATTATNKTKQGIQTLRNAVTAAFPNIENIVLIQGNHDQYCDSLSATGGFDMGEYSVYVINEKDFPSGGTATQTLCQQTADRLNSWLSGLVQSNYDKPVFVLTHVPLHYSGRVIDDGDSLYAQLLFDVLSAHGNDLNIFFMYGHNHAHGDDDYLGGASQFLSRGDKLTIAQAGNRYGKLEKTLNFTYMNYGFVGYYWDDWASDGGPVNDSTDYSLTMTTFEIDDNDVIIRRWDENGQHLLKAVGAPSLGYRGFSDPLPANTQEYKSPMLVRSPKSDTKTVLPWQNFEDDATSVSVEAFGSALTVKELERLEALEREGITAYRAFDITVKDFVGSAEVTLPSRPEYNAVWHVSEDGVVERISDVVFNDNNTVTFTATHFSDYGVGSAPPEDGAYLVKTPASELKPGDRVLILNKTEDYILYPGDDAVWCDPYNLKSLYEDEYSGTIDPIIYNGKTYYRYDAHMQEIVDGNWKYLMTVTDDMGLENSNGKYLNLAFDSYDINNLTAFKDAGAATINDDGTISHAFGSTTYYLTLNTDSADLWYGFQPRTKNDSGYKDEYAQLTFYRLENYTAPEPGPGPDDEDDYALVNQDAWFADLENYTYRITEANAYLYHSQTPVVTSVKNSDGSLTYTTVPFSNGGNDTIEFYDAFKVGEHSYNVCLKAKVLNSAANKKLYWGSQTYASSDGFLSVGQFRITQTCSSKWMPEDMSEPETDMEWEIWLEDADGNPITDERLFQETGQHLAGGSVYVAPDEYITVYSTDNTIYTNISEGIEFDHSEKRWHTLNDDFNKAENYMVGIPGSANKIKGQYKKGYTNAGCELAVGTYSEVKESFSSGDIDFLKYEKETAVTGIEGSKTGIENVHTICLDIVPPEKKDIAILMVMDTTSSMRVQCANCGVPLANHTGTSGNPGRWIEVTNWEGETYSVKACDHFEVRADISYNSAVSFINDLADLPITNANLYVRLVPFAGDADADYMDWVDVTKDGGVDDVIYALDHLPQKSGTNISAGLRCASEILSDDLPENVSTENTYVLLLTDGAQSKSDIENLPDEALTQDYIDSWLEKWENNYDHYERVVSGINEDTGQPIDYTGFFIGAPYYAEKIMDEDGLNAHLYTVMLGNNLDWGAKTSRENWRYTPGIGIAAHDHLRSFSEYSVYATSESELKKYYEAIADTLTPTVEALTVTDPMSDHVDFLEFTDSNGKNQGSNVAVYDEKTQTITWNPLEGSADPDGHYRLYYNVRIKTEASGFVDSKLYPANKRTTAKYELKYPNGHIEKKEKDADIPEIKGQLGQFSFTKISENGGIIAGAEFKMVHDQDCPYCHNKNWPTRAGATFADITFKSDANGNVQVTNIPSGHTYKLYETKAPQGFLPFEGSLSVDVSYGKVTVNDGHSNEIWNNQYRRLKDPSDNIKFTITKNVYGSSGTESFPFEVTLSDSKGNPVLLTAGTYSPEGSVPYVVAANGKITFKLKNQESVIINEIPSGTKATITETISEGYTVKYVDENGTRYGVKDEIVLSGDKAVTVVNTTGARLPDSGGIGNYSIYALGVLILAGSIMCSFMLRRKEW